MHNFTIKYHKYYIMSLFLIYKTVNSKYTQYNFCYCFQYYDPILAYCNQIHLDYENYKSNVQHKIKRKIFVVKVLNLSTQLVKINTIRFNV